VDTEQGLLRYRKRGKPAQATGGDADYLTIKWIFFDLGSTLIDETEADERRIREMTAGTDVTPEAYREKRLECLRQGLPGDAAAIACFGLAKTPWHSELERPCPDAAPVLAELQRRGWRLGVIANQNPGTEERLAAWDLLQYFDVVAPSAELGVAKPDPAIFRWALDRADCKPGEAVMVGDRLDNDIAPAKALGFHTVRLLRGLGACQTPRSPEEEPDHTIRELAELMDLMPCNAERADVSIGPYGATHN
jgi:putative hydrolase of the HAD superfamily